MKKILILGAGEAQLNLIRSAKKLEYYVIVCDMRSDTEAEKLADKYYKINYMNMDEVYEIGLNEKIDGVISNSEPAMTTVSYLVDKLGVPGNSTDSINKLMSKTEFRRLQEEVGVFAPRSFTSDNIDDLLVFAKKLNYPIIIKPTESSGSRGTTRLDCFDEDLIKNTFIICKEFSRNGFVSIEEFVEMESLEVINADVFVYDNDFIWDGWYGGLRSSKRPMIPMAKILPPNLSKERESLIKDTVEKILAGAKVSLGEFNVETYFSKSGELFVIEINVRQAGDDIPKLILEHTGVDLTKLLVSLTVNDTSYYDFLKNYKREENYITLQVVFCDKNGEYQGLYIDDKIKPFVCWIDEFPKIGDTVNEAVNAADSVAYIDLKFNTLEEQMYFTYNIEDYIYPIIK